MLAALGYIAIMAAGMFTAGHVFGISYGTPEMTLVLLPFEVVMSLYAVVMARRIFGHWQCGFGPVDWRGVWWLAPSFLVIAALFVALFLTGTVTLSGLALAVIATTILVGFSEELVFRGIVLKGALPRAWHGPGHPALRRAVRIAARGERAGLPAAAQHADAAGASPSSSASSSPASRCG